MNPQLEERFKMLNERLKENPPPPPETRRIGKFRISSHWLKDDWRRALPILAGVVVVRAEMRYEYDAIEYIGLCDGFEETAWMYEAPEYRAVLETQEDGSTKLIKWEKSPC